MIIEEIFNFFRTHLIDIIFFLVLYVATIYMLSKLYINSFNHKYNVHNDDDKEDNNKK